MMVRILLAALAVVVVTAVVSAYYVTKSHSKKYRNGVYEGSSQSIHTAEAFWGNARVEISNRRIARVEFSVVDKVSGETLDLKYCGDHFGSNPEYLSQCRHDLRGVRTYTQQMLKAKNLKKVHAVAGATWSYNLFKASVEQAMAKAA
jgi:major membrane immunogen (membrane-anchored lipoprotein)